MIGKLNKNENHVVVLGAGISGLLAAYQLAKSGYEVDIYEKTSRVGGLISTNEILFKNKKLGISESAAHSLLMSEKVQELFNELNIDYCEVKSDSKSRYIYRDNKLQTFPLNFFETCILIFKSLFIFKIKNDRFQSLEDFCLKYLGRPALKYLLTPFVTGVYAAKPKDLCVEAAFPFLNIPKGLSLGLYFIFFRFFKKTKRTKMVSLKNGMQDLVIKLENILKSNPRVRFHFNQNIDSYPHHSNIVIALPTLDLKRFFKTSNPTLSEKFSFVEYSKIISITVLVKHSSLKMIPKGVGVLMADEVIDSINNSTGCLGILFNSSSFENRVLHSDWISLTLMLNFEQKSSDYSLKINEILKTLFGYSSSKDDIVYQVYEWDRAIPIYNKNLMQAWDAVRFYAEIKTGIVFFGNWSGQVSLRGMIEDSFKIIP